MMNHEKLLKNIDKKFLAQWQDIGQGNTELEHLLVQLEQNVAVIKKLNDEKKGLSAKIGQLKKAGSDIGDLISQQQTLKQQLGDEKTKKNDLTDSIKRFFAENSKTLPARYTPTIEDTPTASTIPIKAAKDVDTTRIIEFLDTHPLTTPYHYPRWQTLFQEVFGQEDTSLVAVDEHNQVLGVLPLTLLSSQLFGRFVVSIPYFNYGGPLTHHADVEAALLQHAIELTQTLKAEHLELRELSARENYQVKQEKVSMIRALPATTEQFSLEIDTKLRAQINRSKHLSPIFKTGKHELLNDFYKVFSRNMRDLGTPVYTKEFFNAVLNAWLDKAFLAVVYLEQKPVACAFLMGYRDVLEIPWASALKETNSIGINMFMYHSILNHAVELKYQCFDFGRSSKDSGTFKFKKQWGAEPIQNYWNYWLPQGQELPQINPNNPKYKLFIQGWKKMPVFMANVLGPHIVKNIP